MAQNKRFIKDFVMKRQMFILNATTQSPLTTLAASHKREKGCQFINFNGTQGVTKT